MAQKRRTTRSKSSKSTKASSAKTSSRSQSSRGKAPVKKERTAKLGKIKAQLLDRRAEISQGMEQSLDYSDSPPLTLQSASTHMPPCSSQRPSLTYRLIFS